MNSTSKAYLIGGGIGSLAAAAFLIRDGNVRGDRIWIFEAGPVLGGSLDGGQAPGDGYSMRGGRMLTTDNYECTWDLFKSIPSIANDGKTVFDETVESTNGIKRIPWPGWSTAGVPRSPWPPWASVCRTVWNC
jgi:oleate hydratase